MDVVWCCCECVMFGWLLQDTNFRHREGSLNVSGIDSVFVVAVAHILQ